MENIDVEKSYHILKKLYCLFLPFFYWILELFRQCGILFIFILFHDKRKTIE